MEEIGGIDLMQRSTAEKQVLRFAQDDKPGVKLMRE